GVTVHVSSSDSTKLLVSSTASTPGTSAVDVVVPNGQTSVSYYVHGVDGTTGTARVRLSAPGFTTDSATAAVVQPVVRMVALSTSYTSLTVDQPFYVYVGIPDCCGGVSVQNVRPGVTGPTVTITSSDSTKARLVTTGGSGNSLTVQVPTGLYYSP